MKLNEKIGSDLKKQLIQILEKGNKIEAMSLLQRVHKLGLKNSKYIIDEIEKELNS